MDAPDDLDKVAKAFWARHWPRLEAAGLIEAADADTFEILCRTWSELRSVDTAEEKVGVIKFIGLSKQFERLAKQFHLLPAERKRRGVSLAAADGVDEFGV